MKLTVPILMDMGKGYDEIEAILGIGRGSIRNCRKKFETEGLDKYLDKNYVPYSGKLGAEDWVVLERAVESGLYTTSQEVAAHIEQVFGVSYSESAVRAVLHKLGFVYQKTSEVPCQFDEAEQEAFLKQLVPFLTETPANEAVFFVDAVHPQHNTRSTYAWVKKGQDKAVPTNSGRRPININGAMNAHRPEEVIIVEADRINAQATIELYDKGLVRQKPPNHPSIPSHLLPQPQPHRAPLEIPPKKGHQHQILPPVPRVPTGSLGLFRQDPTLQARTPISCHFQLPAIQQA